MKDKFVFYSKSPNKKPGEYKGTGWSESVTNIDQYSELAKIDDWRKMFSNFYESPFTLDDREWNSVEHFFHAVKFRDIKNNKNNPNYKFYQTFSLNSKKPWNKDPALAKMAGKAGRVNASGKIYDKKIEGEKIPKDVYIRSDFYNGIDNEAMKLAFFAKFTQNEELKKTLLATKDAELYHLVTQRGKESKLELWKHLMVVRSCIRKFDNIYDLAEISKFSSEIVDKVLNKVLDKNNKIKQKIENLNISYDKNINIDFSELLKNGVMVFPGPKDIQKEIRNFNDEQIEFVNPSEEVTIMGGFGAYGNPTSFHHPEIRNIRRKIHYYLWNSLKNTFKNKRAELLFDRFSKRRKGTSTSAESWHRDITNCDNLLETDIIYGGWVNLDPYGSEPQGFSCVPGTQIDKSKKTGFAKFTDKEMEELNKKKKIFKIPPGHIIMFNQNIAHEVLPKKATFDSCRLYVGWRITDGKLPLYDNSKVIQDQAIIRLPGGMHPQMYSANHWMFPKLREGLIEWSKKVRPEFREERLLKSKDEYYDVVQQYMTSLRESGLEIWPEYTEYDKKILTPLLLC